MIKHFFKRADPRAPARLIAETIGLARAALAPTTPASDDAVEMRRRRAALEGAIAGHLEGGENQLLLEALRHLRTFDEDVALARALETLIRRCATSAVTEAPHAVAHLCCISMYSSELDYAVYSPEGPEARMPVSSSFEMALNGMSELGVMGKACEARGIRIPVPVEWLIGLAFVDLHALTRALLEAVRDGSPSRFLRALDQMRRRFEATHGARYSKNVALLFLHFSSVDLSPFSALEIASIEDLSNPAFLAGTEAIPLAQKYSENQGKWASLATRLLEGGMSLPPGSLEVYPPTYLLNLLDDFRRLCLTQGFVSDVRGVVGAINPKNVTAAVTLHGTDGVVEAVIATFSHIRSGKVFGVARYAISDVEPTSLAGHERHVQTVKRLLARVGVAEAQVSSETLSPIHEH
ncbi:hypothetical protein [Paraburkholderia sp. J8-2]|uniref:hypothetical protein n=1 Tax=Paraburkholderia sp. J8-2 TaxID=2805440 RepID=UPI002AB60EB0|nr:hypothetical protein [Paraburkholderia sp. J8-2]